MRHIYEIADGLAGTAERALRTALGRFATGITVITTRTPDGIREGMTVNAFCALSLDPPLVLWCARRDAPSRAAFERAPRFAVNVLAADQRDLSTHFATPAPDKFDGVACRQGLGNVPLIEGSLACFECTRHDGHEGGDHVILVGRVERFSWRDAAPLLFSAGRYAGAHPHPDNHDDDAQASAFADLLL